MLTEGRANMSPGTTPNGAVTTKIMSKRKMLYNTRKKHANACSAKNNNRESIGTGLIQQRFSLDNLLDNPNFIKQRTPQQKSLIFNAWGTAPVRFLKYSSQVALYKVLY
jgi:hypothetical protein